MSKKNHLAESFAKWRKEMPFGPILNAPRRTRSHRVKMLLKYWLDERVRGS